MTDDALPGDEVDPASVESTRTTLVTVERATEVLGLFATSHQPDLGVTEIAAKLGLSKTVVHRLLRTLAGKDLLVLDAATHRYRLGPLSLRLGMSYLSHIDVRRLALPRMRELSARTLETVTISLRNGWTRVYVDQVLATREVHMAVTLGQPVPLHVGASSKVLLAFLESEEQDRYLSTDLSTLTDDTVIHKDELRAQLGQIQEAGYAMTFGERLAGAGSIAAPVLDHRGQPAAVVSVCGPVDRFRSAVEEFVDPLLTQTRSLSHELGFSEVNDV